MPNFSELTIAPSSDDGETGFLVGWGVNGIGPETSGFGLEGVDAGDDGIFPTQTPDAWPPYAFAQHSLCVS